MAYDLAPASVMFADVADVESAEMEIVHWDGGISIVPSGPVITRDADGGELHRLP
ncbi:hypothetical protein OG792_11355 [Micromonospora sp. NBC_01699]|uniref:hypothetical protein n=1 Tax=Micromonospora sp. NBC_01699 TaxID=2975984 RepID=UPI002E379E0B|nr:hypothetical protein [Micromonospora sp. NBC_01699]